MYRFSDSTKACIIGPIVFESANVFKDIRAPECILRAFRYTNRHLQTYKRLQRCLHFQRNIASTSTPFFSLMSQHTFSRHSNTALRGAGQGKKTQKSIQIKLTNVNKHLPPFNFIVSTKLACTSHKRKNLASVNHKTQMPINRLPFFFLFCTVCNYHALYNATSFIKIDSVD